MKNVKKVIKMVSSMMLCCLLVANIFSTHANAAVTSEAEPNVQLYYAQLSGPGEAAYDSYLGYVAVKNLGFDKNVVIHYTKDGQTWNDFTAAYVKADPNDSQYDIYSFNILAPSSPITFAVKYQVNGQTYWDNNNGANYHMEYPNLVVLGKSVVKTVKIINNPSIIYVKNLAYQKTVKIRYTTNNWNSYQDVDSKFYKAANENIDEWNIPQNIPTGAEVKYEVLYSVNGITYIDNNFGDYYTNW